MSTDHQPKAQAGRTNGASKGEPPAVPALRRLVPGDAAAQAEVEAACLGSEAWPEHICREVLEQSYAFYVGAFDGTQLIGTAGLQNLGGDGEISNVAVVPAYRRGHIADRLLQALLSEGAAQGIRNFTLEVRAMNAPAIGLYEKSGFRTEGRRPHFYTAPDDDALIMWKRI